MKIKTLAEMIMPFVFAAGLATFWPALVAFENYITYRQMPFTRTYNPETDTIESVGNKTTFKRTYKTGIEILVADVDGDLKPDSARECKSLKSKNDICFELGHSLYMGQNAMDTFVDVVSQYYRNNR